MDKEFEKWWVKSGKHLKWYTDKAQCERAFKEGQDSSSPEFLKFDEAEKRFVEWWRKHGRSQIMCGSLMHTFYDIIVGNYVEGV